MTVRPQFDAAAERLMAAEIESGRMFASEGLKTARKFFAMVHDDSLVLKLPEDRVEELIASEGAAPFEVGNRRMREWVRLQPKDTQACAELLREARTFVKG